ncbi:hypothetical protein [Rhodospira trueperi]|uniref:Uncharacterized protein n=1 Tax=Rhodospira trueperi TaxID=69960 RepID=A0A1G7ARF7_9PROT|nr:hypothetical protein [Rhodospira trueperi]SDE17429.1 hypothetical protein SAMN05421720_10460 [Rhodospira trueperi]
MTSSASSHPRPRPRPLLGLVAAVLAGLVLLAVPATLAGWRLLALDARAGAETLEAARADAETLGTVARAVEGARGLGRQIRFAPAGAAGAAARQRAALLLRVLSEDPAWRADLPASFGAALDQARAAADLLTQQRDTQSPWPTLIADRLRALSLFADDPGQDSATPRARALGRLHQTLSLAARSGAPALGFLEREARRQAARAIAAPGLPIGLERPAPPGSGLTVHAVIAAALDIPEARRSALANEARADRLWREADDALARAADIAQTTAVARLSGLSLTADAAWRRLRDALLASLLAVLALAAGGGALVATAYARPLSRLGRRAADLGLGRTRGGPTRDVAWTALENAVAVAGDTSARDQGAIEAALRRDAATLRLALLGAASEAAAGRALAATAPVLARTLADDPETARDVLSALRRLAAGADDTPHAPLDRILTDVLAVLDQQVRHRGLDLTLTCPPNLWIDAPSAVLAAVVCYVVEAAVLRAEDHGAGSSRPVAVSVTVEVEGSDRLRLVIDDDGPPASPAAAGLLPGIDDGGGPADPAARLAQALREEPDAAALLLADGLARAGLGTPLAVTARHSSGPRTILTVRPLTPG